MLFSARTAPRRRLPCTDNTAECSLRPGSLFSGLPILSGYVMVPVQFLYRDHNFLTQITDTFMDFAICASVMPPFLFFLIILFTFDSSSFFITQIWLLHHMPLTFCTMLPSSFLLCAPSQPWQVPPTVYWAPYTIFWTITNRHKYSAVQYAFTVLHDAAIFIFTLRPK